MSEIIYEDGSYRDNFGRVFYHNNEVFRFISNQGLEEYETLKQNNIFENAIKEGYLIDFKELSSEEIKNFNNHNFNKNTKILKIKKIDYISYGYEWTFSQLRDAAIHHLDFQIKLIKENVILRDSSSFNIQFQNGKPIFIDIFSLAQYEKDKPWLGYKQFCEFFLNPLLIYNKKNINFNHLLKGSIDGVSVEDTNKILSFSNKLNLKTFIHVTLHNYLINNYTKKSLDNFTNAGAKKVPKNTYISILTQLKNWIGNMRVKKDKTIWSDYMIKHTYNNDEFKLKQNKIEEFIKKEPPNKVIDFGCNNGLYSKIALNSGAKFVLGLDFDHDAITQAYNLSKKENLNFIPLIYDAINPPTNSGWKETERKSFLKRNKGKNTYILALAFIHHLAIAKNIPLEEIINYFLSISNKGIIEFVPKSDPTVKKMLLNRVDIFDNYNQENFERLLSLKSKIISKTNITNSNRILYEYKVI